MVFFESFVPLLTATPIHLLGIQILNLRPELFTGDRVLFSLLPVTFGGAVDKHFLTVGIYGRSLRSIGRIIERAGLPGDPFVVGLL